MNISSCTWKCLLLGMFGGLLAGLLAFFGLDFPTDDPTPTPQSICGVVWKDPLASALTPHSTCQMSPGGTPVANAKVRLSVNTGPTTGSYVFNLTTNSYGEYCLGPSIYVGAWTVEVLQASSTLASPSIATATPWCDADDPNAQSTHPAARRNKAIFTVSSGASGTVHQTDFGYK